MKIYMIPAAVLFIVLFTALVIMCFVTSGNSAIGNPIEPWIFACNSVDFFLPLIVSATFVPPVYMIHKKGFARYAALRNGNYMPIQLGTVTVLVFLSVTLSYYIALLVSLNALDPAEFQSDNFLIRYVFGRYQIEHPYLFGAVWCMWKGAVSTLFALFGNLLTINTGNLFVSVLAPFLYVMGENLLTALIQKPQYSIVTSFVLNRLSPTAMRAWYYPIGVITFTLFSTFVILVIRRRSKNGLM